ncbi:hypothetical protein PIB30_036060 [Stylosanthes scabra]|uniref:J domain-containing protein n=1 Tax=Stylosanthes scabra TaxID=79078 RepID=A0ABU6QCQ2_9FABA|nr:hypothetical protein [Stylosanthes scabra]
MDESNKEKAIRAKEISEKMFGAGDVNSAMRFACQARNLFPDLEGIEQMMKIYGMHMAAKNKINGEIHWYNMLGVAAQDDVDTMREAYVSLASLLLSDSDKYVGADGAFELASQAWSVLSDKAKRAAFDEKINAPTFHEEVKAATCKLATECEYPPSQEGANCDHNVTKSATSNAKIQKENSSASRSITFWTICPRCKIRFLYPRVIVNCRLSCYVCNEEFIAVEVDRRKILGTRRHSRDLHGINPQANDVSNLHRSTLPRKTRQFSSATQAKDDQKMYQKVKRKRNEEQVTKRENALQEEHPVAKKGYFNPTKIRSALEDMSLTGYGERNTNEPNSEYNEVSQAKESCIVKGIYQAELHNHLMDIAVNALSTKLAALSPDSKDSQKVNETGETFLKESDSCDQDNCEKPEEERTSVPQATMPSAGSNTTTHMLTKSLGKMSIEFPTSK